MKIIDRFSLYSQTSTNLCRVTKKRENENFSIAGLREHRVRVDRRFFRLAFFRPLEALRSVFAASVWSFAGLSVARPSVRRLSLPQSFSWFSALSGRPRTLGRLHQCAGSVAVPVRRPVSADPTTPTDPAGDRLGRVLNKSRGHGGTTARVRFS